MRYTSKTDLHASQRLSLRLYAVVVCPRFPGRETRYVHDH